MGTQRDIWEDDARQLKADLDSAKVVETREVPIRVARPEGKNGGADLGKQSMPSDPVSVAREVEQRRLLGL